MTSKKKVKSINPNLKWFEYIANKNFPVSNKENKMLQSGTGLVLILSTLIPLISSLLLRIRKVQRWLKKEESKPNNVPNNSDRDQSVIEIDENIDKPNVIRDSSSSKSKQDDDFHGWKPEDIKINKNKNIEVSIAWNIDNITSIQNKNEK